MSPSPPPLVDPLSLGALDNYNNQPAMGATKAGGGWRESANEATTWPRWWATTNNESVRRMMMAAIKRVRVARAMVTAIRVAGNKEGNGNKEDNGIGNKGGV